MKNTQILSISKPYYKRGNFGEVSGSLDLVGCLPYTNINVLVDANVYVEIHPKPLKTYKIIICLRHPAFKIFFISSHPRP